MARPKKADKPEAQVVLSDGGTLFEATVGGQEYRWTMGLVSTIRQVEDFQAAAKRDGKDDFALLEEVVVLVNKAGGPLLSLDQADEFIDLLYVQLAELKKKRRQTGDSMPPSANSMGSMPPAGMPSDFLASMPTFRS